MVAPLVTTLADESAAGGAKTHGQRLKRYVTSKNSARLMANYLGERDARRAIKLHHCANFLHFRHYMRDDKITLVDGYFCQQWKLCQQCAIRRGAKALQVLAPKITDQLQRDNQLRAYLVTVTTKNGGDCAERFSHLKNSFRKYMERRNDGKKKNRGKVEANKAAGIYWAFEGGIGENSKQWHWHCHAVWLCRNRPHATELSAEWEAITGDSYIVDVREMRCTSNNRRDSQSIAADVLEVCKYTLKPHGMTPALAYQTHQATQHFHFTGCVGSLRLSALERERIEAQYDERPDESQETCELFYRFSDRRQTYQEADETSKITHLRIVEVRRLNREASLRARAQQVAAAGCRPLLDTGAILGDRYAAVEADDPPDPSLKRGTRLHSPPSEVEDVLA